ncbi:hypothetical protein Poli38472_010743 [Pythium oligandrum]|uniref:WRKY19-like zinc finger domain-containing protein n=1 Tax=Pythium oligandrum TaxID=41045 RepID=A0A8K1FFI1_PYTOL|nr:hypothetical protein Poli38472_010743 [Pythium oligandrum]|eukprot:TMW61680.1 hypothetical protein Poli38472_010743 [Pythium oligandrum]
MAQVENDFTYLLMFPTATNDAEAKTASSDYWSPPRSPASPRMTTPRRTQLQPQTSSSYAVEGGAYPASYETPAYPPQTSYLPTYAYPPQQPVMTESYYPTESTQWQGYGTYAKHPENYLDPLPMRQMNVPTSSQYLLPEPAVLAAVDADLYDERLLHEALATEYPPRPMPHTTWMGNYAPAYPYEPSSMPMSQYAAPPQLVRHDSSALSTHSSDSEFASTTASLNNETVSTTSRKRKRRSDSSAPARLCRVEGCTKGIRSRGLCKAHGGGRRCLTPGCTTSDQGGGHCVLHGGGRRCTISGCTKSAQWKGLCKMHGGARRCRYENCTKNGQVKQGYCRSHHNLVTRLQQEAEAKAAQH